MSDQFNSPLTWRSVFVSTRFWFLCDRNTAAKRRGMICVTGHIRLCLSFSGKRPLAVLFFFFLLFSFLFFFVGGAVQSVDKAAVRPCNTLLLLTAVGERRYATYLSAPYCTGSRIDGGFFFFFFFFVPSRVLILLSLAHEPKGVALGGRIGSDGCGS